MFKLNIDTGNDAMRAPDHLADALEDIAAELRGNTRYEDDGIVYDLNGNTVGRWTYQLDLTQDDE